MITVRQFVSTALGFTHASSVIPFARSSEGASGTVTQLQDYTRQQTTQGTSQFSTPKKGGLSELPLGVVTLLFRPFPFEATSPFSSITKTNGVAMTW